MPTVQQQSTAAGPSFGDTQSPHCSSRVLNALWWQARSWFGTKRPQVQILSPTTFLEVSDLRQGGAGATFRSRTCGPPAHAGNVVPMGVQMRAGDTYCRIDGTCPSTDRATRATPSPWKWVHSWLLTPPHPVPPKRPDRRSDLSASTRGRGEPHCLQVRALPAFSVPQFLQVTTFGAGTAACKTCPATRALPSFRSPPHCEQMAAVAGLRVPQNPQ